jgi:hypothetical protein
MAIETHTDPKTRKPYMLAVGKVTGAYINEIKELKTYSGPNGPWTPTKRLKIVVDGVNIDLGMSEKDQIRAKDVDDNYHDVVKGVEVSVVVEENGEYQGKPQYRAKTSAITVLDVSGAQAAPSANKPAQTAGGAQSFKPKDMTGVRVGHALNGAFEYLLGNGLDFDYEKDGITVKYAKLVNEATETVRTIYAARNVGMSDYDIGAASGHAVLNACRIIPETPEAEFKDALVTYANFLLDNVVPAITDYIKQGAKAPAAKASPPAAKKAATKARAVPKAPAKVEPEDDQPATGFDDFDDDIPF